MKQLFIHNRRDSAIFNCGIYAGLAFGWGFEPFMRWLFVPLLGEPIVPIVALQSVFGMGFAVVSAMIIEHRDRKAAAIDEGTEQ